MTERCLAGELYDCDPNTCQHDCAAKIDLSPASAELARIDRLMKVWMIGTLLAIGVITSIALVYTKGAENRRAVEIAGEPV